MAPWLFLIAGCLVGMGLLGSPHGLKPEPEAMLWAGCGFLLEVAAPRLPRFGFASTAAGLWLGLSYHFAGLSWLALLGATGALLLRASRSLKPASWGILELLADLQPLALALGFSKVLGQPALLAPLWFLFWWLQPAYLLGALEEEVGREWGRLRARLVRVGLLTAALGTLGYFVGSHPAVPVLFATALGLAAAGTSTVVLGVDSETRTIASRQKQRGLDQRELGLDVFEQGLLATDRQQRQTGAELEARLETYKLVDSMLESIPQRLVFQAVADLILRRLQSRFKVTNIVLFWLEEGQLTPRAWLTPYPDRLTSAPLTQQSEPIAVGAFKLGRLQVETANRGSNRLFPEDAWTVAAPLPERGCLYLGHPTIRAMSEEDRHFLEVLARHSVLALDAAAWYQTLQTTLQSEAATAARNEALVQRLASVIDGVTQLIRLRDPQAMLQSAASILAPVVPHRLYYAQSGPHQIRQGDGEGTTLPALATRVNEQNLPLMLDNPHRLAVPLMSERGSLGGMVLERDGPAFTREEQDIMSVLCYQLGSAMVSAQLYAELQKTHAALRDSQAQLMQSSKMAAVGQLAGGVAHELNTPLGAVALAIEAAQMNLETKPDRALARLERATKAVGQMKEIVSKLLFYSRDARSGWRETHLNQVVEDTLQMVGHQLKLDNIQVEQQLGEVPSILANANELQQVLTNLVLNARDAMLSPGATGRQLTLCTGSWGKGVWFKVKDQGPGIPDEVKERIFEPFFTTKEVGKGTGLGLSVTAQLLQQHGATITVQSQPGHGAEFEVRLLHAPPEA